MFISGDKVVLVDDKWPSFIAWYDQIPIKNKTYTIRDVRMGRTKEIDATSETADVVVTLEECKNGPDPLFKEIVELAFKAERFRKLQEKKEKMKKYKTELF